jgi:hypothetical protein
MLGEEQGQRDDQNKNDKLDGHEDVSFFFVEYLDEIKKLTNVIDEVAANLKALFKATRSISSSAFS